MNKQTSTALFLLLVLLGAACSKFPAPEGEPVLEKPAYGDEMVMGSFTKPDLLNPLLTHSSVSANLFDLIFDSLMEREISIDDSGEGGQWIPSLAERWEVGEEGKVWTFFLRKGVLFHDGTELTAEDVKFSYEQIARRKGHAYRSYFKYVKSFSAPERYLFRMEFSRYDHAAVGALVLAIVPRHLLEGRDPQRAPFDRHPIGSGPFRFVSQNEKEIVLEANEDYFGGRPYLNRVRVRYVHLPQAYIDLAVGKIDTIDDVADEYYQFLSRLPEVKVYRKRNVISFYLLALNTRRPAFRFPEVRRAIDRLIDRQRLTSLMPEESVTPADGPLPPWDDTYLLPPSLPESVPEIPPLRFTLISDNTELERKIIEEIQSQLRPAGIRTEVKTVPTTDLVAGLKKGNFDATLLQSPYFPWLLSHYVFWHSSGIVGGFNFSSYSNRFVDDALDRIRFDPDEGERRRGWIDFQKAFRKDPPAIFLFWRYMTTAIHKRFRGFLESNRRSMKAFRDVWVPKEEQKYE